MRRIAPLILIVCVVLLCAILFFVLPLTLERLGVQDIIQNAIEERLNQPVTFDSVYLSVFPRLAVVFEGLEVQRKIRGEVTPFLNAESLRIQPKLLPLLFRRLEVGRISVDGGRIRVPLKTKTESIAESFLTLSNISLNVRDIRTQHPFSFSFAAGGEEGGKYEGKGKATIDFDTLDLDHMSFGIDIHLTDVALRTFNTLLPRYPAVQIPRGRLGGDMHIEHNAGEPLVLLKGDLSISDFAFVLNEDFTKQSQPLEFQVRYDLDVNRVEHKISCRELEIESDLGKIGIDGEFGYSELNNELDLHMKLVELNLDELLKFATPFQKAIPYNVGFSGSSSADVFLKGETRHFRLSGEVDLSNSLLTYSRYIAKPKDLPLKAGFNFDVSDRRLIEGDFDLEFLEMVLKGTLAHVDIEKGDGVVTLITNKFDLSGWQNIIEPLSPYELSGGLKFLLRMKGNFKEKGALDMSGSLNLDGATAKAEKGLVLRNIGLRADFESNGFEIKNGYMDVDGSGIVFNLSLQDFGNPTVTMELEAGSFSLYEFLASLHDSVGQYAETRADLLDGLESARDFAALLLKDKEPLRNVKVNLGYENDVLKIDALQFYLFGGQLDGSGFFNLLKDSRYFAFTMAGNGIDLKGLTFRPDKGRSYATGLLSFSSDVEAAASPGQDLARVLKGQGKVFMRDVSFKTFDLVGGLSKLSGFIGLAGYSTGDTELSAVEGSYYIRDRKIQTDNLTLISPTFSAQVSGYTDFEGAMNYRIELLLDERIVEQTRIAKQFFHRSIPIQLYGTWKDPDVSFDLQTAVKREAIRYAAKGLKKLFGD